MVSNKELRKAHKPECTSKGGYNTEIRNECYKDGVLSEYDCYCAECGRYLYHFANGHEER